MLPASTPAASAPCSGSDPERVCTAPPRSRCRCHRSSRGRSGISRARWRSDESSSGECQSSTLPPKHPLHPNCLLPFAQCLAKRAVCATRPPETDRLVRPIQLADAKPDIRSAARARNMVFVRRTFVYDDYPAATAIWAFFHHKPPSLRHRARCTSPCYARGVPSDALLRSP